MSDEIGDAAARLAAAMPRSGTGASMSFGTVVGTGRGTVDVLLGGARLTVPATAACSGCSLADRAVVLTQGPLAVCVGTIPAR